MKENNTNNQTLNNQVIAETLNDLKSSILIVSVGVNLTVLVTWMAAQLSTVYAAQLMTLF